jgi:VCBS repeat-containing protein
MAAGHGIRAQVLALTIGAVVAAAPASASDRHGTRVATGTVVRQTAAESMRGGRAEARGPHALPVRRGEPAKRQMTGAQRLSLGRSDGPRTSFGSTFNFAGPSLGADSTAFPPDTQGAVGPSQFLVTINGRFRSYSKATGLPDGALDQDPDAFFAGQLSTPPPGGFVFSSDPHVRYDRLSQHWFIVMIDAPLDASLNATKANRILVAYSDGPTLSPSTVWTKFFVQVSGTFADYPTLGVDANALYVGTNNFAITSPFGFQSTSGYVLSKSSVLGGGTPVVTTFTFATGTGSGPFTPQGADNPDPGATQGYFVGVDNAVFSQLDVIRISSPGGSAPTASSSIAVGVPTTRFPINVPHLGNTGGLLDALDDRLFAASIRNNRLWTAHNIQVNSSGNASASGNRDGSRWYELNVTPATPSVVQSGTVFDSSATNPLSYWIPTVAVSGQGHMAIGGSVAGAARHADAWFSGRLSADTLGATDAPTLYTASPFAYNPPADTGSPRRWGDYSAVSLDPVDDMTMWTIQEYASATNTWATRIARLRAPGPAIPASVSPRPQTGQASASVTLTGTTTGGRGFFDPGPGFNRPGLTAGCGVDVTSVTVNSPSQASLMLDTTAATNAPCSLTFTNPDGQSATASVNLLERAPTAVDDTRSAAQDSVLNGSSVLANDSDPDGDALTAAKASDPSHGTVSVNANGTFTYTPAAGYTGPDSFTYTASDGTLQDTGTVSITVTAVTNHPPVAVDDAYSVPQDSVLNGSSVLANDSDPDGDALTAAKASDPSHGTVSVNANGTFTYTPAAGYTGPDSFTYTASDAALQDTGTVSITVTAVNHAPVTVGDAYSDAQDTVLSGTSVLANDSDPDGDPLTAAKASDPSHGAVTMNADGTFTYTPVAGYSGPDGFTYTASDGTLQTIGTVSIAVTPVAQQQQPPITQQPLPDMSTPGAQQPQITKLTIRLKQLKKRHGKRRLQASGAGPAGAAVRVALRRNGKWIGLRTVKATNGRWRVVFRFKRRGRYRVVATSGQQRASANKRI